MTVVGKVTAKGQTTIPVSIREAMNVSAGDLLAWEMGADGMASVRRVEPRDVAYLAAVEATLTEWSSAADEESYRDL